MAARIVNEKSYLKGREALFASRPTLYALIILAGVLVGYAYKLRTNGIFACQANGYSSDLYLGYCQATGYGDYEHGAFWFGLEPSALNFVSSAQVLFLGDSHLQFALSTTATADWSASASAQYYLLGFLYYENVAFEGELLRKLRPQAKVYVLAVDFFDRSETPPAREVMRTPAARSRYEVKRLWQLVHKPICEALPPICGDQYVVFRSRETGAYSARPSGFTSSAVSYNHIINPDVVKSYAESGRDFLSHLPVKQECVILTQIPAVETNVETAIAVASALGVNLVAPELDDLQTFDGVHLDRTSAERWSKSFFQAAGAQIRRCLDEPHASRL
jgi:hypothetical protein